SAVVPVRAARGDLCSSPTRRSSDLSDHGCPWDREQTFSSLKKCLADETEEVFQAVDNEDMENLCEELGDVLLQVVMNSQIAAEIDRKSTRLNSSHVSISYAVFCLTK